MNILKDGHGKTSSSRVIKFLCLSIIICIIVVGYVYNKCPPEYVYNGLIFIAIGTEASSRFDSIKSKKNDTIVRHFAGGQPWNPEYFKK